MSLGYPEGNAESYTDVARRSHYDLPTSTDAEHRALEGMRDEARQEKPIISR